MACYPIAGDAQRDHSDVVRAAAQIRQIDHCLNRLARRKRRQDAADLIVLDLTRQSVAAQQKRVTHLDRKRTLQVDLDLRVGAERTGDDVLRHVEVDFRLTHFGRRLHLPYQAVVERELIELVAAQAVDAAIAYVRDDGALRQKQ